MIIYHFSTIITIAHRLNTVLDYDRVLVLKDGNLAELDTPKQLMQTEGSIFRSMCQVKKLSTIKSIIGNWSIRAILSD